MKLPLIHYFSDGNVDETDEIFCLWETDTLNKINICHTPDDEGYLDIRSSVSAADAREAFNIIADSLKEFQLVYDCLNTIRTYAMTAWTASNRICFDKLSSNFDFSMTRLMVNNECRWLFEITIHPQIHAHWNVKTIPYDHIYKRKIQFGACSNCGHHTHVLAGNCHYPKTPICPHCFAIMDEISEPK